VSLGPGRDPALGLCGRCPGLAGAVSAVLPVSLGRRARGRCPAARAVLCPWACTGGPVSLGCAEIRPCVLGRRLAEAGSRPYLCRRAEIRLSLGLSRGSNPCSAPTPESPPTRAQLPSLGPPVLSSRVSASPGMTPEPWPPRARLPFRNDRDPTSSSAKTRPIRTNGPFVRIHPGDLDIRAHWGPPRPRPGPPGPGRRRRR
jgi:hypothetical protein